MDCKEVRIGNKLNWDGLEATVLEVSIRSNPAITIQYKRVKEGIETVSVESILLNFSKHQNKLSPIPLTEEWLVRLGGYKQFENVYMIELYRMGESFYAINLTYHAGCWKWWLCTSFQTRIMYVHQLQNLYFALTGKELNVI